MAVPKRKVSISRKKIRNYATRATIKKSMCNYAICPNCNFIKKKHHLCKYCGYYREGLSYKI